MESPCRVSPLALSDQLDGFREPATQSASPFWSLAIRSDTSPKAIPETIVGESSPIDTLRKKYNVYCVRPGMTGWAQINGRDSLTDEEKAKYDKEYVENQSLLFDFKILSKTFGTVLKGENIVEGSEKKEKKLL